MKRMVTLSVGLLALCGPSFAGPRLFVPNKGQATVAVFDQSYLNPNGTGMEVDTDTYSPGVDRIAVGSNPTRVAVTPDSRWAFCTNSGGSSVTWFSARPLVVAGTNPPAFRYDVFATITVGSTPKDLVVAQDNNSANRIVVANTGGTTVSVIDPHEDLTYTTTTVNVLGYGGVAANPKAIAVSPSLSTLVYVATDTGSAATIATLNTGATLPSSIGPGSITLPSNHRPIAMALSPDASQIWVVSTQYVTVYRRSDNTQLLDYSLPGNLGGGGISLNGKVALFGKGNKAYVSVSNGNEGHVYVFWTSTNPPSYKGSADVGKGAQGVDVAPDDSTVWAANSGDNNLSVLDGVSDQPLVDNSYEPLKIVGDPNALSQPWNVTFVPEDTRKFDVPGSYVGAEQWPMFAGGGLRTGLASSPIQELISNRGTSPGGTGTPAWSVNVNGQPWTETVQSTPIPLTASPVSANYSAASDTIVLATYTGTSSSTIYAYATTGNGGNPSLRWSKAVATDMGPVDGFVATPVVANSTDYHWYQNMQYVVAVSLTGRVYSLAVHGATYYLGSNPYFSAGSIVWWGRIPNITINTATCKPFVVSSPVRYGNWLYAAVVWKDANGNAKDCGLVRISAEPTNFDTQLNSFSGTIQIYYRVSQDSTGVNPLYGATSFWTAMYGSPAISQTIISGNPGVIFTLRTPTGGDGSPSDTGDHGYVYRVPIQTAISPAVTWVTDLPSNGFAPTFNEVGSPSVAYGKVFVGTYGDNTHVTYALDSINGTVLWAGSTMTLGSCGSLHPPAVYDGNVMVASDDTGGIESFMAEPPSSDGLYSQLWGTYASVDGYAAFASPVVVSSGTLLCRPYSSQNLWGIDTELGPTAQAPSPRTKQSLGLGVSTTFNACPAVVYVSGTGSTAGRWTFIVSSSGDGSNPEKLQAILKSFTW